MVKTEIVKISSIKKNPDNPRNIDDDKFQKLVQSIKDFPEMLNIRPIVVNNNMMILGGNMRLSACLDAGLKEVPIIKASNLTTEQQKEFIIKDNVGFGSWDWNALASKWDSEQLGEWGLDVIQFGSNDIDKEWIGMPEYNQADLTAKRQLIIAFDNEEDVNKFAKLIKQNITDKTKTLWFPMKKNESLTDHTYND